MLIEPLYSRKIVFLFVLDSSSLLTGKNIDIWFCNDWIWFKLGIKFNTIGESSNLQVTYIISFTGGKICSTINFLSGSNRISSSL